MYDCGIDVFSHRPMIDVPRIRELLSKVPRPPEDAIPEGASESQCDAFQRRTGLRLPHDVRDWLKISNGPCVGPGGLYGIRPARSDLDIESILEIFPSWRESKWIPVAGDGCGNYYLIPTQQEYGTGYPVLFVDTSSTPDAPAYIVASDMGRFVVALLETELGAEGWPFNEHDVTKSDPQITRFKGLALPWAEA
jgi:hypothetical protein